MNKAYALLDARGLVLHAYFAVRKDPDAEIDLEEDGGDGKPITTPQKGFSAFLDMYLDPLLSQYSPKEIIAVWEGGNDYRTGLYSDYKGNRKGKTSSLKRKAAINEAMGLAKNFLAALGCLQGHTQGVEADDMIAALALGLEGQKVVHTVDADLLQLAGEYPNGSVSVCMQRELITDVYKGVPLHLIRLQKSLCGDSSDGYSGVAGIGEVAWQQLVEEYDWDGMEALDEAVRTGNYSMIEEVLSEPGTSKGYKALAKINEQRREWDFWYHIAGLHPHLCYRGDAKNQRVVRPQWYYRLPSPARLRSTLERGHALDLLHRYQRWMPTEVLVTADNLGDELARMFSALELSPFVSLDFETSDKLQWEPYLQAKTGTGGYVDVLNSTINGASFNYGDNLQHTIYISVDHRDTANVDKQVIKDVIDRVQKAGKQLVIQNEQFEVNILANEFGDSIIDELNPIFDTQMAASYVDENESAGLKSSSLAYLNYQQTTYKQTLEAAADAAGLAALGDSAQLWLALPESLAAALQEKAAADDAVAQDEEELADYVEGGGSEADWDVEAVADLKNAAAAAAFKVDALKKDQARLKPTYDEGYATVKQMKDITGEQVVHYGCDDAFCTSALAVFYTVVMQLENSWKLFCEHDQYVAAELINSFRGGLMVDYERLSVMEGEDAKKYEISMARIRELLAEHCSVPAPNKPDNYISEMRDRKRRELIDSGKHGGTKGVALDHEGLNLKMQEWEDKLRDAAMYRPFVQTRRRVEFTPTPKQMAAVVDKLFVQDNPSEPLKPPTDTSAGVTKFLTKAPDVLSVAEGRDAEAERFLELIGPAASQLKAREGEQYQAFADFCAGVLAEDQPLDSSGDELNFNSPKQMTELFYCKLGLPVRDRNKQAPDDAWRKKGFQGAPSTGDKAIEMAIVEDCPEGDWRRELLENLRTAKSCMTKQKLYYKPWPLWKSPVDGVMHPQVRSSSTTTRRPTASDPNLLAISKKDDGRIRTAVVRRHKHHCMISADFNGQELRIMTSESKDPVLLDAYIGPNKKDIHTVTASAIAPVLFARKVPVICRWLLENGENRIVSYDHFNALRKGKPVVIDNETGEVVEMPLEGEWTFDMVVVLANEVRKVAKAVNFLIIYGGNEMTLARNLSMPKDLAKAFIDTVLNTYRGITPWQENVVEFARTYGYTQTAYGSRRHATADLFSGDFSTRSRIERQLINFTIQGCAADILKKVLSDARKTRLFADTKSQLIAPVYDEILASVPVESAYEYCCRLQDLMNLTPPGHQVPMLAEVSVGGYSWGNQKELGAAPTEDEVLAAIEETSYEKLIA